eukprot:1818051-Pyramimonas_sp.AAC.1
MAPRRAPLSQGLLRRLRTRPISAASRSPGGRPGHRSTMFYNTKSAKFNEPEIADLPEIAPLDCTSRAPPRKLQAQKHAA